MPSRENTIIAVFVVLGIAGALLASWVGQMGETATIGILLFVGVILPMLLNDYIDDSAAAGRKQ